MKKFILTLCAALAISGVSAVSADAQRVQTKETRNSQIGKSGHRPGQNSSKPSTKPEGRPPQNNSQRPGNNNGNHPGQNGQRPGQNGQHPGQNGQKPNHSYNRPGQPNPGHGYRPGVEVPNRKPAHHYRPQPPRREPIYVSYRPTVGVSVSFGGVNLWFSNGNYYRAVTPNRYEMVMPPVGMLVPQLFNPWSYFDGGCQYFVENGVVYVYDYTPYGPMYRVVGYMY